MNRLRLTATILFRLILGAKSFSFEEAQNWGEEYPKCIGKHQSPIIYKPTSISGFSSIDQKLRLSDFHKLPKKLTIRNTGHTVEIKADWPGEPPKISGGPLDGNYVLEKTTFLWAQKKVINDRFMNTTNESYKHFYDNLERNLYKVQSINSTAEIPPFCLASTFENRVPPFLFYEGSLDHPPCFESVTWFISDGDLITKGLLKEFRKIKLAEGDISNVKPRQALNNPQIKSVYIFKDNTK